MMLKGKTALVTGSTSGIGLGIAVCLARQGANVLLNGFGDSEGPKAEVAAAGQPHGVRVGYHAADMTKPDEIEAMMAVAEREFGGVDILVNNAGVQHVAPVEDFPTAKWDAIIAINLSSAFHTTRLAIPGMRRKNWGRIINIASTQGLVGSTGKVAYVAAKHGIVGMTKVVALETATTPITANAICPGYVLTPLVQKQVDALAARDGLAPDEARRRFVGDKHPSLEFTTPEQLGGLAVFLCSAAADNVRGQAWAVDGGWTTQ
jgi:3-hydroxybutyrate dehydrogenase